MGKERVSLFTALSEGLQEGLEPSGCLVKDPGVICNGFPDQGRQEQSGDMAWKGRADLRFPTARM